MNTKISEQELARAVEQFHAGNFDSAAALLDSLLTRSADRPDILLPRLKIALRQQHLGLADELALRAVAAHPENAVFRHTRSEVLLALHRNDEALAEARQALRIDPGFHEAHVAIWRIMKACNRMDELIDLVKQRLAGLDTQCRVEQRTKKVRIPDTTLCCIDCKNHIPAIRALKQSLAGCEFPRAMFLTDRQFDLKPIETVIIDPIGSWEDYSRFVMKSLLHYIDTEYVLIVQWDGYVVNPDVWSEQFLLFDYIGPRWPPEWFSPPADHAVGNGGFSLRSRTLLEALQDPRIIGGHPEDRTICMTYRQYLEQQHGVAFAPAGIADQFSFDRIEPAGPTFGFHGQMNITRFVDDAAIRLLEAV